MFQRPFARLKLLQHFIAIVRDTTQTDRVFQLIEGMTRDPDLSAKYPFVGAEAEFLRAPFEQGFPELEQLRAMPEGSFGRALAVHMDALGVDFAAFDRGPTPTDDREWLDRHGYETHDIWHVITGWGAGAANEIGLQGVYFGQLANIPAGTILLLGLVRGFVGGREEMVAMFEAMVAGWTQGRRAKSLFGVDWRPYFELPLAEVRAAFDVEPIDAAAFVEVEARLAA